MSQLPHPVLLPMPRHLVLEQGAHSLRARHCTIFDATRSNHATTTLIQQDIRREVHASASISAPDDKSETAVIVLKIDDQLPAQGYTLHITPRQVLLVGADSTGLRYAALTLRQLLRHYRDAIPACKIEDSPDFPIRGIMLDISRDKVPTMATLFRLVEEFAEWKINRLELYTEHTFAYRNHRDVWVDSSPMTAEEVRELDAFCADRHIELVPNQNCFGHLHRWLNHNSYKHLAEAPDGFDTPWGERRGGPFSLNPLDPGSIALVDELLGELLPNFSSKNVNVGCDETFDLGQGRSREACARSGKGRVYLDFLLKIHRLCEKSGKRMHFWGDIVLNHPELITDLPRDVVPLIWGYEADHPFAEQCQRFAEVGLPFFVCPGTSTWNSIIGRTDTALANLENASEYGKSSGATGYLITSWGDNGHWQPYAIDLLPLAAGAARGWCLDANRNADLPAQADAHIFKDAAGVLGQLALNLGFVHNSLRNPIPNASALFRLISQRDISGLQAAIPPERLHAARNRLNELTERLRDARCKRDDGDMLAREFLLGAALVRRGIARGLNENPPEQQKAWETVIADYRAQWLDRNRPGGLSDSIALMEKRRRGD